MGGLVALTLCFRVVGDDGVDRTPFITSSYTEGTLVFPAGVVAVEIGAGEVVDRARLAAAAFTTPKRSENDLATWNLYRHQIQFSFFNCIILKAMCHTSCYAICLLMLRPS